MIGEEARARMRAAAATYPSARSATLTALHIAQQEEGYITPEGVDAVAEVLGLRADEVDSVVSFYSMYFRKPVGRHVIKVCTSISCYLRGCDQLLAYLEQRLGIQRGETTPDGAFTLLGIECLASCGTAPVLQVNDEFVENVTLDRADALIEQLRPPRKGHAATDPAGPPATTPAGPPAPGGRGVGEEHHP
ncbi:MAG TPA: NADH-quinone oxidoreductase subunit NuoE [Ktedonobacterales bacterium]|nr:NADH-quinone oxidoreductase subunit NuoE [Ktedonobacterales bacterium]